MYKIRFYKRGDKLFLRKVRIIFILLGLLLIPVFSYAQEITRGGTLWTETDGAPAPEPCWQMTVTNGTLGNTGGDCTLTTGGGGGGAPTDADYLVGTANASLSAEIVVGTSPGGELGNTWASPTIDDSVAVTSWNLTTPTITTSLTTSTPTTLTAAELDRLDGLTSPIIDDDKIDTFAELDVIVADKALVNKADGAVWLGVHDFGGATSLEVPNGAPTVDTTGEIGIDTTDDQLLYMGGTVQRVIPYTYEKCFSLETPAVADDNWIVFLPVDAISITSMYCMVNGGTSAEIQISDGTNACESIVCDADGQADDSSIVNGTFTANERMEFDTIAVTGTVPEVTYCIRYTVTAQ